VALAVFAAALAARLAFFAAIALRNSPDGFFAIDSAGYWQLAQNLIAHGVFSQSSQPPFAPDAQRTPVYPLFLAALRWPGLSPLGVVLAQSLLGAASAALTVRLSLRLAGSARAAAAAGIFVALDLPSIATANLLLTETLFTGLLVASAALWAATAQRGGAARAAGSGALLGLAILCRPVALALPLVWAAWLALAGRARRARALAACGLACALVVAPWLARNQRLFGAPLLSTIGATNLHDYRAAAVHARVEGISLAASRAALDAQAAARFQGDPERDPVGFERFKGSLAQELLRAHPGIALRNHVVGLASVFFHPMRSTLDLQLGLVRSGSSLFDGGQAGHAPLLERLRSRTSGVTLSLVAVQGIALAWLWTGVALACARLRRGPAAPALWLVALLVLYHALLVGGPEGTPRFRVPLVPFLALAAGAGFSEHARAARRKAA
jgi:hypothetical protein